MIQTMISIDSWVNFPNISWIIGLKPETWVNKAPFQDAIYLNNKISKDNSTQTQSNAGFNQDYIINWGEWHCKAK